MQLIKNIIFVIYFILMMHSTNAQHFRKIYTIPNPSNVNATSSLYNIIQTLDGGYAFTQPSRDTANAQNSFTLIKTDFNGITQWAFEYDSLGVYEYPRQLIQLPDSSFVIIDEFSGVRFYCWHISNLGSILSVKEFRDTVEFKMFKVKSICNTMDGNLLFSGSYAQNHSLVKADINGNVLWAKTYHHGIYPYRSSFLNKVIATSDGGYITGGSYRINDTSFAAPDTSFLEIVKTDSAGNVQWFRQFGNSTSSVSVNAIAETNSGDFLIGGKFEVGLNGSFILKMDSAGNCIWFKFLVGYTTLYIKEKPDSNYLVCTSGPQSQSLFLTVDTSGSVINLYDLDYFAPLAKVACTAVVTNDYGAVFFGESSFNLTFIIKIDSLYQSGCYQNSFTFFNVYYPFILDTSVISANLTVTSFDVTPNFSSTPVQVTVSNECPPSKAIEDLQNIIAFDIYPNPCNGTFSIMLSNLANDGEIEIYNSYGIKILKEKFKSTTSREIKLVNIISGIYFVHLSDGQNVFSKKLIVEQK